MKELIEEMKQYLQEEYSSGDCVLADIETCNYFRDHFKKQMAAPKPIVQSAPIASPVPKVKPPTPPPPKVEKPQIKPVQTIDHSEFKNA